MAIYVLDPAAADDFGQDWATKWLEQGETIASFTVTSPDGLTVSNATESGGTVTYRVSGGTLNSDQHVNVHVTSSSGREDDRTDTFMIRDR